MLAHTIYNYFLSLDRVVNLSSGLGNINYLGDKWKENLTSPNLTVDQLLVYMEQYVK